MTLETATGRFWETPGSGLLMLIGSSPLPNLLALRTLAPPRVAMIASCDTQPSVERLVEAANAGGQWNMPTDPGLPGGLCVLSDPYRAASIRDDVRAIVANRAAWVFFYTGGTKAMATQVHSMWTAAGGLSSRACYLSDRDRALHFDDGSVMPLPEDPGVDLAVLGRLHGLRRTSESSVSIERMSAAMPAGPQFPLDRDVDLILRAVLDNPTLADRLAKDLDGRFASIAAGLLALDLWAYVPGLSVRTLDATFKGTKKASPLNEWLRLLRGLWLDAAIARMAQAAGTKARGASVRRTYRSVCGFLPPGSGKTGRDFELDVAQVWGGRLYAISCTTETGIDSSGPKLAKLKVFEVRERARQLGGDLARSAFVCLLDRGRRDALRDELSGLWRGDVPPTPVFGIDDVREWASDRLDSLVGWLDS